MEKKMTKNEPSTARKTGDYAGSKTKTTSSTSGKVQSRTGLSNLKSGSTPHTASQSSSQSRTKASLGDKSTSSKTKSTAACKK